MQIPHRPSQAPAPGLRADGDGVVIVLQIGFRKDKHYVAFFLASKPTIVMRRAHAGTTPPGVSALPPASGGARGPDRPIEAEHGP